MVACSRTRLIVCGCPIHFATDDTCAEQVYVYSYTCKLILMTLCGAESGVAASTRIATAEQLDKTAQLFKRFRFLFLVFSAS
jgi:hypothetical protein